MTIHIVVGDRDFMDTSLIGPPYPQDFVIPYDSIEITDSTKIKSDSLSFVVLIRNLAVMKPLAGQPVWVYDYPDVGPPTTEFGGVIQRVTQKLRNPDTFAYECEAQDWTRWLDRLLCRETYPKSTLAGVAIRDMIAKWAPSFDTTFVQDGYSCGELAFDFVPLSAAIDEISEKLGWQWWVDSDKKVHFMPSSDAIGAEYWHNGRNYIDADVDLNTFYDLELTEDVGSVKNKIYVKDYQGKKRDPVSFSFVELLKSIFTLGIPIFTPSASDVDLSIYLQARVKDSVTGATIRTLSDVRYDLKEGEPGDQRGTENTIYLNMDIMTVRLPDDYPLQDGEALEVTYWPAESQIDVSLMQESIDLMKEREGGGTSGIYEYAASEPGVWTESGEEPTAIITQLLNRYGQPLITGTFKTWIRGWKAGQWFYLKTWKRAEKGTIFWRKMFVQSVTRRLINEDTIESIVNFASTPYGE